jgi:hypothetical protein
VDNWKNITNTQNSIRKKCFGGTLTFSNCHIIWSDTGKVVLIVFEFRQVNEKYLKNLTELEIFTMVYFEDDDLRIVAHNCPKLVKIIVDTEEERCDRITFEGIKDFVEEYCASDSLNHADFHIEENLTNICTEDWDYLVHLVNELLPKIADFKVNDRNVELYY